MTTSPENFSSQFDDIIRSNFGSNNKESAVPKEPIKSLKEGSIKEGEWGVYSDWNPFESFPRQPLKEGASPHNVAARRLATGIDEAVSHVHRAYRALSEPDEIITVDHPAWKTSEHVNAVWHELDSHADAADSWSRSNDVPIGVLSRIKRSAQEVANKVEAHPSYTPDSPHYPHMSAAVSALRNLA
jgi:hypothetical protein